MSDGMLQSDLENAIILDKNFWQALGKQQGWKEINYGFRLEDKIGNRIRDNSGVGEWHYIMLEFIDHIAQGGNIDEFFDKLLTN